MADIVLVLVVIAFFGLCVLYIRGCDRIIRRDGIDETDDIRIEPVREVTQ